jgi:hypothetical protein
MFKDLKRVSETATTQQQSSRLFEKLQAMEVFKDTHLVKLELLSNATTIDSALHYITSKQVQQQEQQKKHLSLDSTNDDDTSGSQITATGRQTIF